MAYLAVENALIRLIVRRAFAIFKHILFCCGIFFFLLLLLSNCADLVRMPLLLLSLKGDGRFVSACHCLRGCCQALLTSLCRMQGQQRPPLAGDGCWKRSELMMMIVSNYFNHNHNNATREKKILMPSSFRSHLVSFSSNQPTQLSSSCLSITRRGVTRA